MRVHDYLAAASASGCGGAAAATRRAGAWRAARSRARPIRRSSETPSLLLRVTINGGSKRRMWSCVQLMSRPLLSASATYGAPSTARSTPSIKPFAANFADEIELRGQLVEARAQFRAALANVRQQVLRLRPCQKLQRHRAGQRPAAKRGAVQPGRKRRGKFLMRQNAPSGSPPASGFATITMSGSPMQTLVRERTGPCGPGRTEFRRRSARRRVAWPVRARASRMVR